MTKNYQKLIKSLQQKKHRQEEQLFLVEGEKSVIELLQSNFSIKALFYTESFAQTHAKKLQSLTTHKAIVTEEVLVQNGTLQTNNAALAVVEIPQSQAKFVLKDYTLALSDIRDPGNLGAIIRIADWYGISQIICSETTVDWYNPKVIIASMGSFTRVTPYYVNLAEVLQTHQTLTYGMFLGGRSLHKTSFPKQAIIVIGNEANGIAPEMEQFIAHKITIPRFGGAESLNAAMATAIVCDNLRR